jgi:hypothetical protein
MGWAVPLGYLEGQNTHNQLKAFVLYGSKETRDLKVSERMGNAGATCPASSGLRST